MTANAVATAVQHPGTNRSPAALAFGLLGWLLMELALVRIGAGFKAQAIAALYALAIVFVSLRHLRLHRAKFSPKDPIPRYTGASNHKRAGHALVVLLLGIGLGFVILAESATLLGLVAGGTLFLRWPWNPLHGFNFIANCAIVVAGAGTVLMLGQNEVHLMFLPIASLMLHLCTAIALVWNIVDL